MSTIRKLSAFRQLSLNSTEQRRKTFKKQFSEDIPDVRDSWLDQEVAKLSKSGRTFDCPPVIKIAWEDDSELKTEEAVIIKRCKEIRRASTGKLSRRTSLEKDSILYSKQEITERLRQHVKEKQPEKPNLKIFLAQDSMDQFFQEKEPPKVIQPLLANPARSNPFKIHRNRRKIDLQETSYTPSRSKDPVVVVPIIESQADDEVRTPKDEIKPIDSVILRPATAASKREKFQKRSNSAFTTTIREAPALVRSSSANARPERGKSKFVATRRKIRSAKRPTKGSTGETEGAKDVHTVTVASEIVTMVSLVSPAGSDAEEEQEKKEKGETKGEGGKTKEEVEVQKNMSLRKTVKTVSFQQSSIHAVRSFSASFPARRVSMATAIMSGSNVRAQASAHPPKTHEKRSTDPGAADDGETVPKRRLVGDETVTEVDSCEPPEEPPITLLLTDEDKKPPTNANITVDIKAKDAPETPKSPDVGDVPEEADDVVESVGETRKEQKQPVKYESPKERQCWELHRRMTEKGINVSLDTILRGMLTPTEYRLSRQNSMKAAEEAEGDVEEGTI